MKGKKLRSIDEILDTPNYLANISKLAQQLVVLGNQLPGSEEIQFHIKSTSLGKNISQGNKLLTSTMQMMTGYIDQKLGKIEENSNGKIVFTQLIDYLDGVCENIDTCLDKIKGSGQEQNAIVPLEIKNGYTEDISQQDQLTKLDDTLKPQLSFNPKPDNSEAPWIPIIKHKLNQIEDISKEITKAQQNPTEYFKYFTDKGEDLSRMEFPHPYFREISEFTPPKKFLAVCPDTQQPPLESDKNYLFVDSLDTLQQMMKQLENSNEIAIDLEHHSFRSYQGFTCLIQISTRQMDFVVDAIALRSYLFILNKVTSDPSKLKVFHGANMDIKWLQRDFGVYVVNLFDTYQAVQYLGKPPFTFQSLLTRYTSVNTDKKYQLADWRLRPLPYEMTKYARRDTHYLLYIYDKLKLDISEKCKETETPDEEIVLADIWHKSKETALSIYSKPQMLNRTYYTLLQNQRPLMSDFKIEVFKRLWEWREQKARLEDESTAYVMSNSLLCKIAMNPPSKETDFEKYARALPANVLRSRREIISLINILRRQMEENESHLEQKELKKTFEPRFDNSKGLNGQKSTRRVILENINLHRTNIKLINADVREVDQKDHQTGDSNLSFESKALRNSVKTSNQKKTQETKQEFGFDSYFSYISQLYPDFKTKVDYKQLLPQNKTSFVVSAPQVEAAEDSEFLEFGSGAGNNSRYLGDNSKKVDVSGILNNSLLPQSLKERFGIELQSKSARDKFQQKKFKRDNKNQIVKAVLQTDGGILSKGNVFDALAKSNPSKEEESGSEDTEEIIPINSAQNETKKSNTVSKEIGKMLKTQNIRDHKAHLNSKIKLAHQESSKSAFNSDQNHTSFSSILEDMEKKMSQAKHRSQKGNKKSADNPQFGLYSKKSIKKQPDASTKRSSTKFGKSKQAKFAF